MNRNYFLSMLVLVASLGKSAWAAQYSMVDLGYLPNSNSSRSPTGSEGLGIDSAGDATGRSDIGVGPAFVTHGFFWNGTTLSDLDAPNSTANIFVHSMSPTGMVVGDNGSGFAFKWTQAGGFTNLPVPAGKNFSHAYGANAAGDIVGESIHASGTLNLTTVWKSTGGTTLLNPVNALFFSTGNAINSSRTVAGVSFDNTHQLATIWNYDSMSDQWTGQSIGTLGGNGSVANDINTAGNVVGQSARASGQGTGAFIWHPGDAAPTDLDPTQTFFGGNTFARGINDNNTVVGLIGGGGAFIWDQNAGIRNLQTLIDPAAPWSLQSAIDINDNGTIIGSAIDSADGLQHAVILKPVPLVQGDFNRNGALDPDDIRAGLAALADLKAYQLANQLSDANLRVIGDINEDYNPTTGVGGVTNADIQPLLDLIAAHGFGSLQSVPEPASLTIIITGIVVLLAAAVCRYRHHLTGSITR